MLDGVLPEYSRSILFAITFPVVLLMRKNIFQSKGYLIWRPKQK